MYEDETIAAISTPTGEGGIGIVRLSGPLSIEIAGRLFVSSKGRRPSDAPSHTMLHGFIHEPDSGVKVDEVLLAVMRAPNTYTREDVVEINCHGGLAPLRRTLELCLSAGARLAGPGEFTRRAFVNGRLDLSQAEAVMDLISARTGRAARLAMVQLGGGLSERLNSIKDAIAGYRANLEAYIDFPEEEIEPAAMGDIINGLDYTAGGLDALARSHDEGRFYREGVKTAIVGRPNVGKSSILNLLLARERAIVTPSPGTTRDVIEECISLDGLPLMVMDTAGIRESHDMAEREGVRRSLEAIEGADVIIAVFDGSLPPDEEDLNIINNVKDRNTVYVLNKRDIGMNNGWNIVPADAVIGLSAKTGEGLDELKKAVFSAAVGEAEGGTGVMVTNLRHRLSIEAAAAAIRRSIECLKSGTPIELAALDLTEAQRALGEVVGDVAPEEILDRIFSAFCIGK